MKSQKIILEKIEKSPSVVAIRSGLIMNIPILMIGSTTLVLQHFPVAAYRQLVETAFSGNLLIFLQFIYNATFGMFSVFLTATISICYSRQFKNKNIPIAEPLTALACFFILSGVETNWDSLGVKGMFSAIVSAILATKLIIAVTAVTKKRLQRHTEGTGIEFNDAVSVIIPMTVVLTSFGVFNILIITFFHVESFFELFEQVANAIFMPLGRTFGSGLLLVLISSVLWFFGIHGTNVLESVTDNIFAPAVNINIELLAQGKEPVELFTKQFFDNFVFMGGCGTAICLLLAIIIFGKKKSDIRLTKLAFVPAIFNINEMLIFGFPVIFNATLFIPFIATPLFAFLTTYIAMYTGIVPLTISEVNWTAPILISGYTATGTIMGSALQLFNVIVGVLIYRPFVLAHEEKSVMTEKRQFQELVELLMVSEETVSPVTLTELADEHGSMARFIAADLKHAMQNDNIRLFYQPQYNHKNVCVGAEALLRWKHSIYGSIYPPLVIQLAKEINILSELEEYILQKAIEDANAIRKATAFDKEIGVNVSSLTIQSEEYFKLLKKIMEEKMIEKGEICLEVTEQMALLSNNMVFDRLKEIKNMGYGLAIDDFSMGHTSLTYLQENQFDTVKLDGSLIRSMVNNPRSLDIIKSITSLSESLGFDVIAEFVEEESQMKMLEAAGCFKYQGYLFSPAISRDELIKRLVDEKNQANVENSRQ